MNESRLPHAVAGAFVSGFGAAWAWLATHGPTVGTIVAIVAGLYSIRASRHTIRLRLIQESRERELDRAQDTNERALDRQHDTEERKLDRQTKDIDEKATRRPIDTDDF